MEYIALFEDFVLSYDFGRGSEWHKFYFLLFYTESGLCIRNWFYVLLPQDAPTRIF